MGKIIILDELTANQIAAGEVIERPSSVVKELVENSIDAGAGNISIEIRNGGIKHIRITDDGQGFEADDVLMAFDKHATSKISRLEDLSNITSLGFRGEALPSIASVSEIKLRSKSQDSKEGVFVHIRGGELIENTEIGTAKGTSIEVINLFYNTPARYKFLKQDHTEASYVIRLVEKIALANPHISFSLISNGKESLQSPGNGDLKSVIYSIFGRELASNIKEVSYSEDRVDVTGYVGNINAMYSNRSRQIFFVNGRFIYSKILSAALDEAYKTLTMKGKFPFAVLSMNISPTLVDVNVHPAKIEVRFSNDNKIFEIVYRAVKASLLAKEEIREERNPEIIRERKEEIPYETIKKYLQIKEKIEDNLEEIEAYDKQLVIEIEEKENKRDDFFIDIKVLGQIWNSYILLEAKNRFYLMDQHAAHERVVYEEIMEIVRQEEEPIVQLLISPINIELSSSEWEAYNNNRGYFKDLGFEIEDFGTNALIIRGIPSIFSDRNIEAFIHNLITEFDQVKKEDLFDREKIFQKACKSALKANQKLEMMEIRELLNRLSFLDNPLTCPHGRPIVIEITKNEIEKRFRRT